MSYSNLLSTKSLEVNQMTDYFDGLYEISKTLAHLAPESQHHGFLGGEYGYGQNYKNDVFEMRPFYWDDCVCDYEPLQNKWENEHHHSADCYQTLFREMHYINYGGDDGWNFDTKPGHGSGECECIATLYTRFNIPEGEWGSYIHCTCGRDEEYSKYMETISHSDDCPIDKPNFKHYASGIKIYWYKYIGRGTKSNMDLDYRDWTKIVLECLDSLEKENNGG